MAEDSRGRSSGPSRVTRPRRARAGFGTGETEEIDELILDTQARKYNSDVIMPGVGGLLLTTNSSLAPAESSTTQKNALNERYFTRPEVIASYRAQAIIETPEFERLGGSNHGGTRLRHKDNPEHMVDMSDAAFERRHRKYEGFEKRQRLREKESLKHQHYQLGQRIEKLKGMDASALMSIPAKYFPTPLEDEEDEVERRREQLLDSAEILSERYHILLYPGRQRKKKPPKAKNIPSPARPPVQPSPSPTTSFELLQPSLSPQKMVPIAIQPPIPEPPHYPFVLDDDGSQVYIATSPQRKKRMRANPPKVIIPPLSDVPSSMGLPPFGTFPPYISSGHTPPTRNEILPGELHYNYSSSHRPYEDYRQPSSSSLAFGAGPQDSFEEYEAKFNQRDVNVPGASGFSNSTPQNTEGSADHLPQRFPLSPVASAARPIALSYSNGREARASSPGPFLSQPSPSSCELERPMVRIQRPMTPPKLPTSRALQKRASSSVVPESSSRQTPFSSSPEVATVVGEPPPSSQDEPFTVLGSPVQHLSYPPPQMVKISVKTYANKGRAGSTGFGHIILPPRPSQDRDSPATPTAAHNLVGPEHGKDSPFAAPTNRIKLPGRDYSKCALMQTAMNKSHRRSRNPKPFGFPLPSLKEAVFNLPGWPWGAEREGDTASLASDSRAGSLALHYDPTVGKVPVTTIADEGESTDEELDQLLPD